MGYTNGVYIWGIHAPVVVDRNGSYGVHTWGTHMGYTYGVYIWGIHWGTQLGYTNGVYKWGSHMRYARSGGRAPVVVHRNGSYGVYTWGKHIGYTNVVYIWIDLGYARTCSGAQKRLLWGMHMGYTHGACTHRWS